ncbi:MAG: aminotransferase class V-fold PLP-dependent enzyme [Clostridia bacterium]|nr:aminotransferase class V-fold PLP-dependent enzyme [Clostridia bacterium]
MIYFDNAATTYPKPPAVLRKMRDVMRDSGGNPGRGSHRLASSAEKIVYECRTDAGKLFGAEPEQVSFTLNATHALNMAIKGLAKPGCHILIDSFAHNASYRPVMSLVRAGICTADVYDASGNDREILASIRALLRPETGLIIATHQSNVCSKVLPVTEIGAFSRSLGIPFIVDASQSAGHLPIDMASMGITALCMPGHKGLMGPMGVGLLISSPDAQYRTILEGGAGIHSLDEEMPSLLPERMEPGTLPLPAIAGLCEGIRWVTEYGIDAVHERGCMLAALLRERLPDLVYHGDCTGNVVSLTMDSHTPSEIGAYLNSGGICVRTGYHCAPLAHKTLGTLENGTVRVSFSPMNTSREVLRLAEVLSVLS